MQKLDPARLRETGRQAAEMHAKRGHSPAQTMRRWWHPAYRDAYQRRETELRQQREES